MYGALTTRPWASAQALAAALNVSPDVVERALKVLKNHGLVHQAADGNSRLCGHCQQPLTGKKKHAEFCSAKCRVYAQRERKRQAKSVTLSPASDTLSERPTYARTTKKSVTGERLHWTAGARSLDEVAAALGVSNALVVQEARHAWERQQSDEALERWRQGKNRGPLHVVPTPKKQAGARPEQTEETPLRQAASFKKTRRSTGGKKRKSGIR